MLPYISPAQLLAAGHLGVSWSTLPKVGSSDNEPYLLDICNQASDEANNIVRQQLGCSIVTEQIYGKSEFLNNTKAAGTLQGVLSQGPIIRVIGGAWGFNALPSALQTLNVNQFNITTPQFTPQLSNTSFASTAVRRFYLSQMPILTNANEVIVQITYLSGFPVATLTTESSSILNVTDVTGFNGFTPLYANNSALSGSLATIYDGRNTEIVQIVSTNSATDVLGEPYGPGTLTLAADPQFTHSVGTIISIFPPSIIEAVLFLAGALGLSRGATSLNVQGQSRGTSNSISQTFRKTASNLLAPYTRWW